MKRLVSILFLISIALGLLSAEEKVWIAPFNTDSVDMASDWYRPIKSTSGEDRWQGGTGKPTEGYYRDNTMLALIGVSGSSEEKTVTFDFNTPKAWKYVSASNDSLYRPFGVDLILKGGKKDAGNGKVEDHELIQDVIHLGYSTSTDAGSLMATVTMPRTDGVENSINGMKYYGSWVDVILVLPGTVNDAGYIDVYGDGEASERNLQYCRLAPANDYMTQFTVTVSGSESSSIHTFILNGYYVNEPETTSGGTVSLLVNKADAASNLDIRNLYTPVKIAEYGFSMASAITTGSTDSKWTERDYYFYLSSDTTGGSDFCLRLVGSEGELNAQNGVKYEASIHSEYDTETNPDNWCWFSGQDSINTSSATITGVFPHAQERVEVISTKNTGQRVFSFYDDGDLYVRLPADADVSHLLAGRYRSSIYFNVVCNK